MRNRIFVRNALVVIQVGILASAFFFFFGWLAMVLYILGEISIAEIVDYLLLMTSMQGFSLFVFFEGLMWVVFKKSRRGK
jgi:hypothetical protein